MFYNQADGTQSRIVRVELDEHGLVVRRQVWLTTKDVFPQYAELNECFVAPDESWFAVEFEEAFAFEEGLAVGAAGLDGTAGVSVLSSPGTSCPLGGARFVVRLPDCGMSLWIR